MAMSSAALASALDTHVTNFDNEPAACAAWAQAYADYAASAAANGVPIAAAAVTTARGLMQTALAGMSVPGTGAAKIQAGVVAFWTSVCGTFAVSFPGSIAAVPPTGTATIAAGLASVLTANAAPGVTKAQALSNIATVIHAATILGGTVTFPPAIVSPIL